MQNSVSLCYMWGGVCVCMYLGEAILEVWVLDDSGSRGWALRAAQGSC